MPLFLDTLTDNIHKVIYLLLQFSNITKMLYGSFLEQREQQKRNIIANGSHQSPEFALYWLITSGTYFLILICYSGALISSGFWGKSNVIPYLPCLENFTLSGLTTYCCVLSVITLDHCRSTLKYCINFLTLFAESSLYTWRWYTSNLFTKFSQEIWQQG